MFKIGDIITNNDIKGVVIADTVYHIDNRRINVIECEEPCHRYSWQNLRSQYLNSIKKSGFENYEEKDCDLHSFRTIEKETPKFLHAIAESQIDYKDFVKIGESQLPDYKFKIGDRVITNKTGPINTGIVSGIVSIGYKYVTNGGNWDSIYPNWYNKPIYYLTLDNPNKNITKEEYVLGTKEQIKNIVSNYLPQSLQTALYIALSDNDLCENLISEIENRYNKEITNIYSLTVPEDDLDIYDSDAIINNLMEEAV